MQHSPDECRVCALLAYATRWAAKQWPPFLVKREAWLDGEIRRRRLQGISGLRMTTRIDPEGTMFLLIDGKEVAEYAIHF